MYQLLELWHNSVCCTPAPHGHTHELTLTSRGSMSRTSVSPTRRWASGPHPARPTRRSKSAAELEGVGREHGGHGLLVRKADRDRLAVDAVRARVEEAAWANVLLVEQLACGRCAHRGWLACVVGAGIAPAYSSPCIHLLYASGEDHASCHTNRSWQATSCAEVPKMEAPRWMRANGPQHARWAHGKRACAYAHRARARCAGLVPVQMRCGLECYEDGCTGSEGDRMIAHHCVSPSRDSHRSSPKRTCPATCGAVKSSASGR